MANSTSRRKSAKATSAAKARAPGEAAKQQRNTPATPSTAAKTDRPARHSGKKDGVVTLRDGNRPSGKLGILLDLLTAPNGATIAELAAKTDWQHHSVHGALSRLRSRGYAMQRLTDGDRNAYRLTPVG